MTQIRIHGRGGQGVVTAAELIAIAAFEDGKYAQAFPSFGVERTGAPIEACARISNKFIRTKQHIYVPDILIIQDPSLINSSVDITKGCNKNTIIILNTSKKFEAYKSLAFNYKFYVIDATKIALDIIGKNIVNTVMFGAFIKITNLISLTALKTGIKQKFYKKGSKIITKNIQAIEKAFS